MTSLLTLRYNNSYGKNKHFGGMGFGKVINIQEQKTDAKTIHEQIFCSKFTVL